MQTPFELQALATLRRRGQCPSRVVFVTDNWAWASKLEDLGCLAIRVRSPSDADHDWSPFNGLTVVLLERSGNYAALGQAILAAGPLTLETFTLNRGTVHVCGEQLQIHARMRRDYLLVKHLIAEAA